MPHCSPVKCLITLCNHVIIPMAKKLLDFFLHIFSFFLSNPRGQTTVRNNDSAQNNKRELLCPDSSDNVNQMNLSELLSFNVLL